MDDFKKKSSFESRLAESNRIIDKYPDRIPVIVVKDKKSTLNEVDKHKYLVPNDLTMGQFMFVLRKRIKLNKADAIYLFCGNILIPSTQLLSQAYHNNKDSDGFLYITYSSENVFG